MIKNSKSRWFTTALVLSAGLMCVTGTAVAGKGGLPSGQPFNAIQGQFDGVQRQIGSIETRLDEIQAQIDELVTDASSMEERIAINEQFIADLQAENMGIKALLVAMVAEIQAQGEDIDINSQAIQALVIQHQANSNAIAVLQEDVTGLQAAMEDKQSSPIEACPEGSAIRSISADGSVTCEQQAQPGFTTITVRTEEEAISVPPSTRYCELFILTCLDWSPWSLETVIEFPECPSGFTATGGGFNMNLGTQRYIQNMYNTPQSYSTRTWGGRITRTPGTTGSIEGEVYVRCIKHE
ncbi:MAG: hypothetical protein IMF07_06690 [Proteobacteria bacterium]|nr:hypothetical protein [Pseudomonadota bacterium]